MRQNVAVTVPGGLATIFTILLRTCFVEQYNLQGAGIVVETSSGRAVLRAVLGMFTAYEAAIKDSWSWKGASGWTPCFA